MPTETLEVIKCADCEAETKKPVVIGRDSLCEDCVATCEDCDKKVRADDTYYVLNEERLVCNNCNNSYRTCEGCDCEFHEDDSEWAGGEEGLCANCYEGSDDNFPYREWKKTKELSTFKKGVYLQTDRLWGIENEAHYVSVKDVVAASKKIDENIGITTDAGAEFQTPPSCGLAGEKMIRQLCYRLKKHGFTVPNGCGFHLHVDAADLDFKAQKNLWLLYIVFDDVIRSFINSYRRTSHWCSPTADLFNKVMAVGNQHDLEVLYYGQFTKELDDYRLASFKMNRKSVNRGGFNLQCVFAEKHLEIRYHEATLSSKRMLEWANLHCLIMDLAKNGFEEDWIERMYSRKIAKMGELFAKIGLCQSSCYYWNKVRRNLNQ